jgi:tetratricopeptide (TPR) repeat protein
MRAALASSLVVVLLAAAAPALAEDKAAARAAYADGTKYYDLNNFEAALKSFEKAYWNYEEPAFLYNIAQCYRQLDRKTEAIKFYRSYLRKVPDAANRAEVERTIATLEAAIATEKPPPSAKEPSPSAPPPVAEKVPTAAAATVTAQPPRTTPSSGRAVRIAGLAIGGAGVASIGLGIAFTFLAKDANQRYLQPADGIYSPSADANRSTYQAAEIATFVIGGAAVVAGTSLYLVGRRR